MHAVLPLPVLSATTVTRAQMPEGLSVGLLLVPAERGLRFLAS
jgi:hypothetical protein